MKKILNFIQSKYYIKFILYIFVFAGLAIGAFYLDKSIQNSNFSQSLAFNQAFLNAILVMMIGSVITIITITFSTIMVVLTLYSGQFSPRTLNDFLQRKVPLNILGFFIGVSVYSIIGLALTAQYSELIFSIFTIIALLLFLIGIILFAYYIHYVSKSVQINIYIDKLVKDAVNEIEKYQNEISENDKVSLKKEEDDEDVDHEIEYHSQKTGYFIDIETEKLMKYLQENNVYITVVKPYNEHVFEDDILFKYQAKAKNFKIDEEVIEACFVLGEEPGTFGEYRNQTLKLVEIAVRALSPGTNDPATAKVCIDRLGYIFMKLSDAHYSLYYRDENNHIRLIIKTMNFDLLLYDHFYQINLYGKQDLKVVSSIIRALSRISADSNLEMKNSLWDFSKYVLKDLDFKNMHKFDFNEVNYELKELAHKVNKLEEYRELVK